MIRRRPITVIMISLIVFTGILPITMSRAVDMPVQTDNPSAGKPSSCAEILSRAMDGVQLSCDNLGRNKACYGNAQVKVEPNGGTVLKFDAVGDRAAIQDIRKLITMPLNLQAGTWGLSLLKLQANLPDTVPGQNVTFLVFGDTSLENTSGDMKAFYFSSTLGTLSCKEMPRDAILVRSPNHLEVSFEANGVDISIGSTILMRAVRKQWMTVTLIEGHAHVATPQGSQTLQPGQVVTIPLGGANGLQPVGAPSEPVSARDDPALTPIVGVADKVADPDLAAATSASLAATEPVEPDLASTEAANLTTITGCVTAIKGNFVVIRGYTINAGSSAALKAAKIGDCFTISGVVKSNNGNGTEFILVKATSQGKSKPASGQGNSAANANNGNNSDGNSNGNGNSSSSSSSSNNGNGNSNGNNGNGNGNGNGNSKNK